MSPETRQTAANAAASILKSQPAFKQSRKVACYLPFKGEFDTLPIIQHIWRRNGECYLPVLASGALKFFSYIKGDELRENHYGILEPAGTNEMTPEMLDMVLLPLLAFDSNGCRLGTGGGFYDKTFNFILDKPERRPLLVGVGFAAQEAQSLPSEPWDIKLDAVVTEADWRVIDYSLKSQSTPSSQ